MKSGHPAKSAKSFDMLKLPICFQDKLRSRGVARISVWGGAQVERRRRETIEAPKAPRDVGCGEGVFPSPLGVVSGEGAVPPPQKNFLSFYIKMVSSG